MASRLISRLMSRSSIVIVDFGSQLTQVIARTVRELGYCPIIVKPRRLSSVLKHNNPKAVILSGGNRSVYEKDAPHLSDKVVTLLRKGNQPFLVLGICYGMQYLAHCLGGKVCAVLGNREYGPAAIRLKGALDSLFQGTPERQKVWASHGDTVEEIPQGFSLLATSKSGGIAAMGNGFNIFGVQFHPEVTHTPFGKQIIENFLKMAGCKQDWKPSSMITSVREEIRNKVGVIEKAIAGFSGGVDSWVLCTMAAAELGNRFLAVTVDCGQFREGEIEEIKQRAQERGLPLRIIDARAEFQKAIGKVTNAEKKRKIFKKVYVACLVRAGKEFGARFILQGSLAPDSIESGKTGGAKIKSHHNIGNRFGRMKQLHPLISLFKFEVRSLARELGLPECISGRQPFPGPGLIVRVIGTAVTPEVLDIVSWADARVTEILKKTGEYDKVSQLVVAYFGARVVGVKGDERVYTGFVVIRAIITQDFMTGDGVFFSIKAQKMFQSVLAQHPAVCRVMINSDNKPPATTEFE